MKIMLMECKRKEVVGVGGHPSGRKKRSILMSRGASVQGRQIPPSTLNKQDVLRRTSSELYVAIRQHASAAHILRHS